MQRKQAPLGESAALSATFDAPAPSATKGEQGQSNQVIASWYDQLTIFSKRCQVFSYSPVNSRLITLLSRLMHLSVGNNSLKQTFKGASPRPGYPFNRRARNKQRPLRATASVQLQQEEPNRRLEHLPADGIQSIGSAKPLPLCHHQRSGYVSAPSPPIRASSSQGSRKLFPLPEGAAKSWPPSPPARKPIGPRMRVSNQVISDGLTNLQLSVKNTVTLG